MTTLVALASTSAPVARARTAVKCSAKKRSSVTPKIISEGGRATSQSSTQDDVPTPLSADKQRSLPPEMLVDDPWESESFEGLIDTLAVKGCDQAADHYLLDVGPGAASVQKRLLRQRVNCCVARAQAGVLLRRLKFALPGWTEAESRRGAWAQKSAQRAAQARAYSGEGHSEEWRFEFSRSYPH